MLNSVAQVLWTVARCRGANDRLTLLVVEQPEGVGVLVAKELTNNNIRIFLYQPVISKMPG